VELRTGSVVVAAVMVEADREEVACGILGAVEEVPVAVEVPVAGRIAANQEEEDRTG